MEAMRAEEVATEAERILKHVRHTHYQYDPVINPKAGTYDVDCAAFVGHLLKTIAPEHFALIPASGDDPYPRAFELYDFFHAVLPRGWRRIEKVEDARRGDIIAWRTSQIRAKHDTGHVLVVARKPEVAVADDVWAVPAYDSSSIVHFDDSREHGGTYHPGVGTGTLRFRADAGGAPIAFQLGPGSEFHRMHVVIARLEDLAAPGAKAARHEKHAPDRESGAAPPPDAGRRRPGASGQRVERAVAANEVLAEDELAFTTYALATNAAMLLPPTTIACWGPGETVRESFGQGATTYTLVGGVVLKNA